MTTATTLPVDNLVRALRPGVEFRDAAADGDENAGPMLFGHFAVFDRWTEIDSWMEGHFMERIAPGAFKKTFRENRPDMRVLFQHGGDPEVGDKPIGSIDELHEDDEGAYYEARLFDGLPPLVMDGLRAGQYGASFRFRVMREEIVDPKEASDDNPQALPERTIKEARVMEFGPVTWGAYSDATAGVRSLTDEVVLRNFRHLEPQQYGRLLAAHPSPPAPPVPGTRADAPPAAQPPTPTTTAPRRFRSREDYLRWISAS